MPRTVLLIRCVKFNARISEMIQSFEKFLPGWSILAVPDAIGQSEDEIQRICAEFPVEALPITDDFIRSTGLHYAPKSGRTGWLCGDYVLYRVLEKEWDFAWIVEPDVFFLNGAEDYLRRLQLLHHDLLATRVWPTGRNWMWGKALDDVIPGLELGAMSFPLLRCSRALAFDALRLRREIATNLGDSTLFPNDEVVVATAARSSGKTSLNIMSLFEEEFRFFSTEVKKNVDDLQERYSEPLFVHAGRHEEEFMAFLQQYWQGAIEGNEARKQHLLSALRTCDTETVVGFLEKCL